MTARFIIRLLLSGILLQALLFSGTSSLHSTKIPDNARVYITHMAGDLDGYIAAELVKQRIPVTVVTEESNADFVLVGESTAEDDHWYDVAFGGFRDRHIGNMRLVDARSKTMVWAGEAGDRSLLFSAFRRGGQRKVAERIVEQMRKKLYQTGK